MYSTKNSASVKFSSVSQLCLSLCDPMDCSMLGFPVFHYLSVCSNSCPLTQWYHPTVSSSVASFSSCPQSFPASGSFPMSQFFASGGLSIRVSASVFPLFRVDFLSNWLVWSCCPRDSQDSSSVPQLESINSSALSLYSPTHICTLIMEKPYLWLYGPLSTKWYLCFLIHCLGLSLLFFQRASIF